MAVQEWPYSNLYNLNLDWMINKIATSHDESTQALETAEAANTAAANAVSTANSAATTANAAKATAEGIDGKATSALTTANSANTAAANAVSTANTAKTTADNTAAQIDPIYAAATTATNQANAAKTAAEDAQTAADAAETASEQAVAAVNDRIKYTDALTLEEIAASTSLTDKVATAEAVGSLGNNFGTFTEVTNTIETSTRTNIATFTATKAGTYLIFPQYRVSTAFASGSCLELAFSSTSTINYDPGALTGSNYYIGTSRTIFLNIPFSLTCEANTTYYLWGYTNNAATLTLTHFQSKIYYLHT